MANMNPRNARNFWVEVETDGRKIATGPRGKGGTMTIRIYQRESGGVVKAFNISCTVGPDGESLQTCVISDRDIPVVSFSTDR